MIKRIYRLKHASDFERVRNNGKVYKHPLFILIAAPNDLPYPRFGIAAGKRIGKAFLRNLVKRRIRACVAQVLPEMQGGWDIILIARQRCTTASFTALQEGFHQLLHRTGILGSVSQQE